jgi:hypothetical protein
MVQSLEYMTLLHPPLVLLTITTMKTITPEYTIPGPMLTLNPKP